MANNIITRTACTVVEWFNARTPGLMPVYRKHMTEYYAPKMYQMLKFLGA